MGNLLTVWLWAREDGEKPKLIARGTKPPGPGMVYEIRASGREDARITLDLFLAPEPDRKIDRPRWNEWDERRDRVRLVDLTRETR